MLKDRLQNRFSYAMDNLSIPCKYVLFNLDFDLTRLLIIQYE